MKLFPNRADDTPAEEALQGASWTYPDDREENYVAEHEDWWKPFSILSALLMFLAILWGIFNQFWQWIDRPIERIEIEGITQHLNKKELGNQIADGLSKPLLQVELRDVQDSIKAHPWVRVAAIKREWPATLYVELEEEVPVARWGEKGLLNHQGDIFWPQLLASYTDLPRLSGPAPDTGRVMSQFHDLNQMFRPAGLHVVNLDLEARGAWTLELDNNIKVVVGRENVNERLQRFLELYRLRLATRVEEIEKIDIRYTHGVAVKWRDKTDEENAG